MTRTRVAVINLNETDFNFRNNENKPELIIAEAEKLGSVYSLEYFQNEINSDNLTLDNSFIYFYEGKHAK